MDQWSSSIYFTQCFAVAFNPCSVSITGARLEGMFKNITLLLLLRTLAFYSVYIIKILNRKKYRLILAYRVAKNE